MMSSSSILLNKASNIREKKKQLFPLAHSIYFIVNELKFIFMVIINVKSRYSKVQFYDLPHHQGPFHPPRLKTKTTFSQLQKITTGRYLGAPWHKSTLVKNRTITINSKPSLRQIYSKT